MYKKPFLLFSLLLMVCGHTQKLTSENLADILIKGSVIDIDTRQPLEYATVSLINKIVIAAVIAAVGSLVAQWM